MNEEFYQWKYQKEILRKNQVPEKEIQIKVMMEFMSYARK